MGRTKKSMDPRLRQVTQLPMKTLWDTDGHDLPATRGEYLDANAVTDFLRRGVQRVAVIGPRFEFSWIEGVQIFAFWKNEAREHLYDAARLRLEDYPGGYLYHASEWTLDSGGTILLFEMYH